MSCMEVASWVAPHLLKTWWNQTKRSQASKQAGKQARLIHINNPSLKNSWLKCLINKLLLLSTGASESPQFLTHNLYIHTLEQSLLTESRDFIFFYKSYLHTPIRSIFMPCAVATCVWQQPASQPASKANAKQASKAFWLQKIHQYYIEKPLNPKTIQELLYSMFCACSKASPFPPLCKTLSSKLSKFVSRANVQTHHTHYYCLPSPAPPSVMQSVIHHPHCGLLVVP